MTSMINHLLGGTQDESKKLQDLVNQWESRCDVLRLKTAEHHAFSADNFDLLQKLMLLLPYVITLFTGGFTPVAILGLLKQVIAMLVSDTELQAILLQIMTVLVNLWGVK